jgi:hypothetical protein
MGWGGYFWEGNLDAWNVGWVCCMAMALLGFGIWAVWAT